MDGRGLQSAELTPQSFPLAVFSSRSGYCWIEREDRRGRVCRPAPRAVARCCTRRGSGRSTPSASGRCHGLWHAVHALVEPVLRRLAGLDPLQADAPPPRRQLAQRGGTGRGARAAVVASLNCAGRFSGRTNVQIRCRGGAQTKAKRSGRLPSQRRGTPSSAMPATYSTGLCARRPKRTVWLSSRTMTSVPARTHLRNKIRGHSCAWAAPRARPAADTGCRQAVSAAGPPPPSAVRQRTASPGGRSQSFR